MFEYVVFGCIQFIRALITGPTCPNCRMQKCTDSTSCLGLGRWSPLLPGTSLELLAWGSCWCCFRPYSFCFPWAFPFNNLSLSWIYIFFPVWRLLSQMSHLETPVSPEPRPPMETINRKFSIQERWLKGDWLLIFMVIARWLAVIEGDWWWFRLLPRKNMTGRNIIFNNLQYGPKWKNGVDLI